MALVIGSGRMVRGRLPRHLLLLLVVQYVSPLFSVLSSAAPTSVDFHSDRGFAKIVPLSGGANASHPYIGRDRRKLLGEAHMVLHDDLLTKGYYTSNLRIGTPPHEFALIVDTGSTVTYVPCATCTHCGAHQDAAFKPADSSTYESVHCTSPICETGLCGDNKQCKYERQYAELSTSSGVLGKDVFGFGDDTGLGSPKLMFGCENDERGDLFSQKADGIMGLGRGPYSIVDQLVREKDMADTFSLCYGGMDVQGGNMIMGDFPSPPGMVFTYSDPGRSPYYNIVLKEIKVAGTALPVPDSVFNAKYGTVLDSGTTYAYLPERAFNAFKGAVTDQLKSLKAVAGPDPQYEDFCFEGAGSDISKLSEYFPTVELVFGDTSLALEPENYLFKHTRIGGAYCLGVFKNDNDHTTLLGGILVRNTLVKYDRANKKIGFWRTNCSELWPRLKDAQDSPTPSPPPPPPPVAVSDPPPPPVTPVVSASPPPPADTFTVDKITDDNIGGLELNISVGTNMTAFTSLSNAFTSDMASELGLESHQVRLVGIQEQGSDVAVTCAVSPASTASLLPGSEVETIIGRLKQHRVQFRSDFGSYHLNSWRIIPDERSWGKANAGFLVGMSIMLVVVSGIGVALWFYVRTRRPKYVKYAPVDQASYHASQQL